MSIEAMFFDLDDTLYPSTSGVWNAIGERMDTYIIEYLGILPENVKKMRNDLFHEYGTTMRGLKNLYDIDERAFLDFVHDIPLHQYLRKDDILADTISGYPGRKIIFTNANQDHAKRVLDVLGIGHLFPEIIDILQMTPHCKPLPEAYKKAIELSGVQDPGNCVMIDDSPRNLKTAQELGFFTIQVGTETRCAYADAAISSILDLPDVIPAQQGERTER